MISSHTYKLWSRITPIWVIPVLLGFSLLASLSDAQAKDDKHKIIYLTDIFKENSSKALTTYSQSLEEWRDHSLSVEGRYTDPLHLNSEMLTSDDEKTLQFELSKTFKIGASKSSVEKRIQAETSARKQNILGQIRNQKSEMAALYCQAVYQWELYQNASTLISELKPLIKAAEKAVDKGSAQSLAFIKWNIIYNKILQQANLAQNKLQLMRSEIQSLTGMDISPNTNLDYQPEAINLGVFSKLNWSNIPMVAASQYEAETSRLKADEHSSWDVEAGVGIEKDMKHDASDAYLVKISIPIEQGFMNADKRRQALAESKLKQDEYLLKQQVVEQNIRLSLMKMRMLQEDLQSSQLIYQQVSDLHTKTLRAFQTGVADFSEVIETLESKYMTQVSLVEKRHDFMSTLALARIMIGDL